MFSRKVLTFPLRMMSSNSSQPGKVCVIGSGPAGFYFAQHLLKALPEVQVDMFDKLPVPFGLVRYGVAPDHPEVKNVINSFTKVAHHNSFNFFGNVEIGNDIKIEELFEMYHAVVLAYGCSEDATLNIKGEHLPNLVSARRFVGWYNGHPADSDLSPDLQSDTAIILGQGNVAIDIARILLTPIDNLKETDITSYALDGLSRSKIKTVFLVGRRGLLHVAFTIKEFREMTKLPGVQTVFRAEHLTGFQDLLPSLARPRKRLTELILKTASTSQSGTKVFHPLFCRKPVEILGTEKVEGVKFCCNEVTDNLEGKVRSTGEFETIPCGLAFRSIGYKGLRIDPAIPFDDKSCTVVNGRGVYSAGWICTGPTGVILTTMNNAFQQASNLVDDIKSNKLDTSVKKPGTHALMEILSKKGTRFVSFSEWEKIDQVEVENGKKLGKSREKIVDIDKMLEIAHRS